MPNPSFVSRKTVTAVCFWLLCLLMNLQILSVYGIGDFEIKVHHVFSLVFAGLIITSIGLLVPPMAVVAYWLSAVLTSLIAYVVYRENPGIVLLLYAVYCFAIGLYVSTRLEYEESLRLLRAMALVVIAAIAVKGAVFYEEFIRFFRQPISHPWIPVFYGGGVNLEATWPGLWTALFIGSRLFYPVLIIATVLSAVYASRVGIVIVLSCLLYRVVCRHGRSIHRVVPVFLLGLLAMVAIEWLESEYGNLGYVLSRFASIGQDTGSVARVELWVAAGGAIAENPFGYGVGNSVHAIERSAKIFVREGNLHNLYLQLIVDSGIQSAIAYCLIIFAVLRAEVKRGFKSHLAACLALYWIAGMVQFRLYEPLFWLILGLYFGYEKRAGEQNQKMAA